MTRICISISCLGAASLLFGVLAVPPTAHAKVDSEPPLLQAPVPKSTGALCQASREPCSIRVGQATAVDTPVAIISDQIRRQGYACDEPRKAERDRAASRPNETVWILTCGNATYRVTLVPDMAAHVERLK
jgi:hypothetical protein